jgi:hypothetical protein
MQKLVNAVALLSGLVSLSVVAGGAYLYLNKDAIIESAKEQAIKQVTETVAGALPGMIQGAMPKMPSATATQNLLFLGYKTIHSIELRFYYGYYDEKKK